MPAQIERVQSLFQFEGEFLSASPHGGGHINDTYAAVFDRGGRRVRYLLQRINHEVFRRPAALMENIQRVTEHLRRKLEEADEADRERKALRLVPSLSGGAYARDAEGNYWRAYYFIEGAHARETAEEPGQAYEAARAFGRFQRMLVDLPGPRLAESIPDFHHTPKRLLALEEALDADVRDRAKRAREEIDFAFSRAPIAGVLLDLHAEGTIPERITHNDTKLNNVLLDDQTGEGLCVTDLDTVMPGLSPYDFGDLLRTAVSPAAEDEKDLTKVGIQMPLFEALARGYMNAAGAFLNEAERRHLVFGGKLITYTMGLRMLTDFLAGDVYYKISREEHNLDRCRTQFKLIESIERHEDEMNAFIETLATAKPT